MTEQATSGAPWTNDGVRFWSVDYIRAPRERVFEHLTRGEHTARFYFGMPISDPTAAGDAVWFGPDRDASPIRGEVTAYDAPRRFAHTFRFAHAPDDPATEVVFALEEDGPEITRLTVHHHGFGSRDDQTYADICSGWPAILSSLKTLLETGEPIAWPEPEEGEDGS